MKSWKMHGARSVYRCSHIPATDLRCTYALYTRQKHWEIKAWICMHAHASTIGQPVVRGLLDYSHIYFIKHVNKTLWRLCVAETLISIWNLKPYKSMSKYIVPRDLRGKLSSLLTICLCFRHVLKATRHDHACQRLLSESPLSSSNT